MIVTTNIDSIVVVTDSADHEFPSLDAAHMWLKEMGYVKESETVFASDAVNVTIATTEYRRDQVDAYNIDNLAQLIACVPRKVEGPTDIIEESGQLAWNF